MAAHRWTCCYLADRTVMSPSELTGEDKSECVVVTVYGTQRYMHASTARELHKALGTRSRSTTSVRDRWCAGRVTPWRSARIG